MTKEPLVLVIDDEADNFDVIETLLDGEGYQLSYISNGKQALALLDSLQPDIILLDVMMPHISGLEFCQRFKANPQWQHIPIIMVTALTTKADLSQCLATGADDFISKPVNGLELRSRVRSMLRIKQQYDRVQSLLGLQEDMVNMIVHDLRNPLASILLSADLMQYHEVLSEKQKNRVNRILNSGQQLQCMIDSLLIMAKLDSGKMVLNRTEVDLGTICRSAISDLEPIATQKSLRLVSQVPESGGSICVDACIFRRAIDNLLSNAIKFSPSHETIILKATCLDTGGAKIQVVDSGQGVNESLRESIFKKYEIGALKQGVTQIGLGLAFCKLAIEAHAGTITIEDNQPQGSIFTILIP